MWGRTDLEKYASGLRRMRNFYPTKQGAAVSRPGLQYLGTLDVGPFNAMPQLVPFVFSDEQSYVLEFGHNFVRFWSNGAKVLNAGVPYEVATPYTNTLPTRDVSLLKYAQSGDVLTLTHPGYPPATLTRFGHTSWAYTAISNARPAGYSTASAAGGAYLKAPLPTPTSAEPARPWRWAVTLLYRSAGGVVSESRPFLITQTATALPNVGAATAATLTAVYQDLPVTVFLPNTGIISLTGRIVAKRIYRGRGELLGWVGDTDYNEEEFIDIGEEPDYSIAPPRGENPLEAYSLATPPVLIRTEEPAAVTYYQERLAFGGTNERPGFLFFSRTGDYYNFDKRYLQQAGDALVFELAARRRESIRSLLPLSRLLVFTNASVWSIAGQEGSVLDFDSVDAKVVEEIGASTLPPVVVDGAALYARTKGRGVRALVPANMASGFKGVDVSLLADHFFEPGALGASREIVGWAYAEDPDGILWAVRADGMLLSLTFSTEDGIWAWAWHDTFAGHISHPLIPEFNPESPAFVRGICSVPEGDRDAVYVVVERRWGVFMERMLPRDGMPAYDGSGGTAWLDGSVRYVRTPPAGDPRVFTGLDHLENSAVWAVAESTREVNGLQQYAGHTRYGPMTVTGGQVTLPEEPPLHFGKQIVTIGLRYFRDLETLDLAAAPARLRQKAVKQVGFEVTQARGLKVGQDFGHLTEWQQRTVGDSYNPISAASEFALVQVGSAYNKGGRACLRQDQPLPLVVVGLTREVDFGD